MLIYSLYFYFLGVIIALLFETFHSIKLIRELNSRHATNFRRAGYRISWMTQEGKVIGPRYYKFDPYFVFMKSIAFLVTQIIESLLSWITVILHIRGWLNFREAQKEMPAALKELRWRIRNMDLTGEEVIRTMVQISAAGRGWDLAKTEQAIAESLEAYSARMEEIKRHEV